MQITHQEARRLIQFNADAALHENDKDLLAIHLESCQECRAYADDIQNLESILGPMLQNRWNQVPLPLSVNTKGNSKLTKDIIMVTRIVAMCVICVAFLFNIWQSTQSDGHRSNPTSISAPPVPTPSQQNISTETINQPCQEVAYTVQPDDTLAGIADQFSASQEAILSSNNLAQEALTAYMILRIPICGSNTTPGTPRTITTMFTPLIDTTPSTPSSGPTQ